MKFNKPKQPKKKDVEKILASLKTRKERMNATQQIQQDFYDKLDAARKEYAQQSRKSARQSSKAQSDDNSPLPKQSLVDAAKERTTKYLMQKYLDNTSMELLSSAK